MKRDEAGAGRAAGSSAHLLQLQALQAASLEDLKARYPQEWQRTAGALLSAIEQQRAEGAAAFLKRAQAEAAPWRTRLERSRLNPHVVQTALPHLVRERMSQLAVEHTMKGAAAKLAGAATSSDSAATVLRFRWWSGTIVQRLFFSEDLQRKPVSLARFRLMWPLVTQKNALMPLVQGKGIYCFYSRPLVKALAALMSGRPTLEIAAGDGTLSRFLSAAGVNITATDDHSWSHVLSFPEEVEPLDAGAALAKYQPKVVVCSWPPPDNRFEREVFRTPSVEQYIVITSQHRFAAGAWQDYEAQTRFSCKEEANLSKLVLPPEVDPLLLVFDRR